MLIVVAPELKAKLVCLCRVVLHNSGVVSSTFAQKYRVDLALWGHHHSYQRTCPVAEEVCTEKGITHVVIGMGGQGLSTNIWPKALTPKWIQVVDDHHHGFSEFTANASTLTFQYIRNVDEGVGDYFVLNKP